MAKNKSMRRLKRCAKTTLENFLTKIEMVTESGCWIWTGHIDRGGYARLNTWDYERRVKGPLLSAHRFSYETFVGPIPEGMGLDHLCRVRCCVNPRHLEPVTHRENVMRGLAPTVSRVAAIAAKLARTHCKWGHPFTRENVRIYRNRRNCIACSNNRRRERRARLRESVHCPPA